MKDGAAVTAQQRGTQLEQQRPRLAFISTIFLLPADAGGKIRTSNILRGMKGGAFEITLIMPATPEQQSRFAAELKGLCDHFVPWPAPKPLPRWTRVVELFSPLPANVAHDDSAAARSTVARVLAQTAFDVVVYDFVHAAVLRPRHSKASSAGRATREVCFTHNVEAEIFERHAKKADNALLRAIWARQAAKMRRFEGDVLRSFDGVIAVSERDGREFEKAYRVAAPQVIPTGVDLDYFHYGTAGEPSAQHPPTAVFTASMDSAANIDGVRFFMSEVWPQVLKHRPEARFTVVGRHPPAALLREAEGLSGVSFTGFVDDVRGYVHQAHAFVIPLRVGGGTRLKAFEAMSMGCPVVSTAIGIEGLDVVPGEHYLLADSAADQAAAVLSLFASAERRQALSQAARQLVEDQFGHRVAAARFEQICLQVRQASGVPAGLLAASA